MKNIKKSISLIAAFAFNFNILIIPLAANTQRSTVTNEKVIKFYEFRELNNDIKDNTANLIKHSGDISLDKKYIKYLSGEIADKYITYLNKTAEVANIYNNAPDNVYYVKNRGNKPKKFTPDIFIGFTHSINPFRTLHFVLKGKNNFLKEISKTTFNSIRSMLIAKDILAEYMEDNEQIVKGFNVVKPEIDKWEKLWHQKQKEKHQKQIAYFNEKIKAVRKNMETKNIKFTASGDVSKEPLYVMKEDSNKLILHKKIALSMLESGMLEQGDIYCPIGVNSCYFEGKDDKTLLTLARSLTGDDKRTSIPTALALRDFYRNKKVVTKDMVAWVSKDGSKRPFITASTTVTESKSNILRKNRYAFSKVGSLITMDENFGNRKFGGYYGPKGGDAKYLEKTFPKVVEGYGRRPKGIFVKEIAVSIPMAIAADIAHNTLFGWKKTLVLGAITLAFGAALAVIELCSPNEVEPAVNDTLIKKKDRHLKFN